MAIKNRFMLSFIPANALDEIIFYPNDLIADAKSISFSGILKLPLITCHMADIKRSVWHRGHDDASLTSRHKKSPTCQCQIEPQK
jgi:hypothetical protein